MKITIVIIIITLLSTGCGSIGAYTEKGMDTQVRFSQYRAGTNKVFEKQTHLKVAQTGLVSGNTLLYSALGHSSNLSEANGSTNVTYPLWINESEVDEVEFAINKYRHWQDELKPANYLSIEPINEYVSEWMNGVTFKFGLFTGLQGRPFMSVCYEFTEIGTCTFTYMIDGQSVELLSDDLDKFKLNWFEPNDLAG